MRKLLLLPLALLTLYLVPSTASAAIESHIPPTEECVQLASSNLRPLFYGRPKDSVPAWNKLIDAGCVKGNPDKAGDGVNTPECRAFRAEGSAYLKPVIAGIAEPYGRYVKIVVKGNKRTEAILRQGVKREDQILESMDLSKNKYKKKLKAIQKQTQAKLRKVNIEVGSKVKALAQANEEAFRDGGAKFVLVYGDILSNGCALNQKWYSDNISLVFAGGLAIKKTWSWSGFPY